MLFKLFENKLPIQKFNIILSSNLSHREGTIAQIGEKEM